MKGVVLAGGSGSRLGNLTKALNKHMLPIYDRPMIYYPIQSLVEAGITDIIIVTGGNHASQFVEALGDGSQFGCSLTYAYQTKAGGIADALSLAESFVGDDKVCVILGDNIFKESIKRFKDVFYRSEHGRYAGDFTSKCHVVCKVVSDPENYGVLTDTGNSIHITEKPKKPLTNLAVTGIYFYTNDVFDKIKTLTPSNRGELEVTDLNNSYESDGCLEYSITDKEWYDCGVDIDHMLEVANNIKDLT